MAAYCPTPMVLSIDDLAEQINSEHAASVEKAWSSTEHAHRAGVLLLLVKAKVDHGSWLVWLAANCKFSRRTAQLYMRVASRWGALQEFSKSATVAHLPLRAAMLIVADPKKPNRSKIAADLRTPSLSPRRKARVIESVKTVVSQMRRAANDLQHCDNVFMCNGVIPAREIEAARKSLTAALSMLDVLGRNGTDNAPIAESSARVVH